MIRALVCLFLCLASVSYGEEAFVILFVDAPQLSERSFHHLCRDLLKRSRVGHAWFYLKGKIGEKEIAIEGGHSGERGLMVPTYAQGISQRIGRDPNPVSYLWENLPDGFFQRGSGNHSPTYAIKLPLTEEQFVAIYNHIYPAHYGYERYNLQNHQCSSLVAEIAALAGCPLEHQITLSIPKRMTLQRRQITLWTDPRYAQITLSSPDKVEASMREAVRQGRASTHGLSGLDEVD